jgi:hypothetical protein
MNLGYLFLVYGRPFGRLHSIPPLWSGQASLGTGLIREILSLRWRQVSVHLYVLCGFFGPGVTVLLARLRSRRNAGRTLIARQP